MKISHSITPQISYALVIKPASPLVIAHITIDLGPCTSVTDSVTRSLLCDLLLSGAGKLSREEFLDAVNEAGGSIAVHEQDGKLTITLETIEARLPKILTLTKLMLTDPTFSPKEITRAKETYRKQLRVASEQARAMAQKFLLRSLYTPSDRAYQFTPNEEVAVLNSVTKKHLTQLYQQCLNRQWIVTIGANERVAKHIQKVISSIHKVDVVCTETPQELLPVPSPHTPMILTHHIGSQQNLELAIGQRLNLTLRDVDYPALLFALSVLGRWGDFTGRLMNTIRKKEGLTYGIYARAETSESTAFGHCRIMTFFHPKDLEQGIQSVLREIEKLHKSGITSTELQRFKTIFATSHSLLYDSLTSLTNTVHTNHTLGLTFEQYEALLQGINTLTVKDINTVIKKYLDPSGLTFSLAGNITAISSQLKHLRSALKL